MSGTQDDFSFHPSRRQLLAASAIGVGIGALGTGFDATPAQAQTGVSVRRSMATLHSASPEIIAYRRAVAVMKQRPFEDPTSWSYQANIHGLGFAPPAGLPAQLAADMGQCVHGPRGGLRHFLPWHRMYLHYFERIVRAASGDPSFNLPYWNYSAVGESALPRAFRVPADFTNPLYESRRAFSINQGQAMPFNVVDTRGALGQFFFDSFSDRLEQLPHGAVHVVVGGPGGVMSSVPTSAQDPIFWLHHCNIDRLWSQWLRDQAGAANPSDSAWLDASWGFYDENGSRQEIAVRDVLDSQSQLGYRYDDELPAAGGIDPCACAATEGGAIPVQLAAAGGVTLSGQRETVTAEIEGDGAESGGAGAFQTEAGEMRPVILKLEEIEYESEPGVLYEVYVNKPEDAPADPTGPYYAGLVAPFGIGGSEAPIELDITGVLNRQIENEQFLGGEVSVEFVPANLPEDGAESGAIIPEMSVGKITIVRE